MDFQVINNGHVSEVTVAAEDMSDGYHTFTELYDHRRALTAALCKAVDVTCWRSMYHHPDDAPISDDYFIVGIDLPTGTITYHYALKYWDDFDGVMVLSAAPKWDGADANATVERLLDWARRW